MARLTANWAADTADSGPLAAQIRNWTAGRPERVGLADLGVGDGETGGGGDELIA